MRSTSNTPVLVGRQLPRRHPSATMRRRVRTNRHEGELKERTGGLRQAVQHLFYDDHAPRNN
eukprot:3593195-Prymnesium_polylepis.1